MVTYKVLKSCENCGVSFEARRDHVKMGWGRFCSRKCAAKVTGGRYKRTAKHNRANSLSKRGLKKTREHRKNISTSLTGHKQSGSTIEKRVSQFRNERHWDWKGMDASYNAKHKWVEKRLGKPHKCSHCGRDDLKHRQYHWANVSRKYKRELSDWIRLCVRCHKKYDA